MVSKDCPQLDKTINCLSLESTSMWENINEELLIYTPENLEHRTNIAAFDMDSTVIKPKSGMERPTDYKDWILFSSNASDKLCNYYQNGYKLVIFTNQFYVGSNILEVEPFKEKVNCILNEIPCPVQVFVALKKNIFRKPAPGMWNKLVSEKNGNVKVDMKKSFYVGDAAGRVSNWGQKKKRDFSIADRLFAINVGLKFLTPEEFFLGEKPRSYKMPVYDPRRFNVTENVITYPNEQEVIVMVGCPASGKSTFCNRELKPRGYVYINIDNSDSWDCSIRMLEEALKEKKNVVVDNTNQKIDRRKRYLDVAKKWNVPCRCFIMTLSKEMAKHNMRFREIVSSCQTCVCKNVFQNYFKCYEVPSIAEGFTEIINLQFVPVFDSPSLENLYRMFLKG